MASERTRARPSARKNACAVAATRHAERQEARRASAPVALDNFGLVVHANVRDRLLAEQVLGVAQQHRRLADAALADQLRRCVSRPRALPARPRDPLRRAALPRRTKILNVCGGRRAHASASLLHTATLRCAAGPSTQTPRRCAPWRPMARSGTAGGSARQGVRACDSRDRPTQTSRRPESCSLLLVTAPRCGARALRFFTHQKRSTLKSISARLLTSWRALLPMRRAKSFCTESSSSA